MCSGDFSQSAITATQLLSVRIGSARDAAAAGSKSLLLGGLRPGRCSVQSDGRGFPPAEVAPHEGSAGVVVDAEVPVAAMDGSSSASSIRRPRRPFALLRQRSLSRPVGILQAENFAAADASWKRSWRLRGLRDQLGQLAEPPGHPIPAGRIRGAPSWLGGLPVPSMSANSPPGAAAVWQGVQAAEQGTSENRVKSFLVEFSF